MFATRGPLRSADTFLVLRSLSVGDAMMRPAALLAALLLPPVASASEAPDAWLSRVQQDLAASEYQVRWLPEAQALGAPNREQGLRAFFASTGMRLTPRDEGSWEWGLTLLGWGRPETMQLVEKATPTAAGPRVEYARRGLVEWYLNASRGIEQGFTLLAPPLEDGEKVHLDLALTGTLVPIVSADGQAIDFATAERIVLRYSRLVVKDARDRELRAWMEGIPGGIRIAFEDGDAVYPVTVDPLATSPGFTALGTQGFGYAVNTAGDVNGDGYSDFAVSQFYISNPGSQGNGRVYLYHGSASGPTGPVTTLVNPFMPTGPFYFGADVGTAGDVNGDGYADLLVVNLSDDFVTHLPARVHLYLGSASGIATTPAWTFVGSGESSMPVAAAGDVNGDGYSDVIVGDPRYLNKGRALVFHGSAAGLPGTPSWTFETAGPGAQLGFAVGTAGDVNGDGFSDVVVGSPTQSSSGYVVAFYGSASGLHTVPDFAFPSLQSGADLGYSVATAGDVNGDGYADVIVGAPRHDSGQTDEGRAFLYLGSASGLVSSTWAAESDQVGAAFGHSVAPAGDINGDGYADVVIGCHRYDAGLTDQGRAFVYFGSASGLIPMPGWTQTGPVASGLYSSSVATAGDVNGDGFADVIVGGENSGRADVFLGSASGLDTNAAWQHEGDQANAWVGLSVAGAGDVDGDGYSDVLVGAPNYDDGDTNEGLALLYRGSAIGLDVVPAWFAEGNQANAQFGFSLASAGDVNGDGYADVVVGAPGWSNGEAGEGKVLVYLGSSSGLAASASWSVEGGLAGAGYGRIVASAGDVNGDGFDELLVGAPFLDHELTDEGRADLYLGSPSGPAASPAWSQEGNQSSALFGWSLGTAGDTNRDGFADVIVGAPGASNGQSNEGRALLYLGSAGGLATSSAWTVESDQVNGTLGRAVGTAGDVNGDGYSDGIVGADGFSNGQSGEGRAWMYLGGVSGLAILPVWSAESDQAGAHFGTSVSTAGDVNGDGFADVVVGAVDYDGPAGTNAGKAYLFQGNPNGLSLVPLWTADGHGTSSFLGFPVAAAGDVDGDGFGDVVVGEPFDDGVAGVDVGRAILFQGGFRGGVALRPRQRTPDGGPVARGGLAGSSSSFVLGLLGRSPFGRGKVRLEWEVKPLGTAFDGTGTQLASSMVDSGVGGASLEQAVSGLAASTAYHWRVRLRYATATTPFAQRGRWVTVPWGGWNETMLRTTAPAPVAAGRSGSFDLVKSGLGVTMFWSGAASCNAADTDHAIYEGSLGNFTSHVPVTCSTAPGHSWNFTPAAGNRYFLLVPINATREGSYGLGPGGAERPVSGLACRPQLVACP